MQLSVQPMHLFEASPLWGLRPLTTSVPVQKPLVLKFSLFPPPVDGDVPLADAGTVPGPKPHFFLGLLTVIGVYTKGLCYSQDVVRNPERELQYSGCYWGPGVMTWTACAMEVRMSQTSGPLRGQGGSSGSQGQLRHGLRSSNRCSRW